MASKTWEDFDAIADASEYINGRFLIDGKMTVCWSDLTESTFDTPDEAIAAVISQEHLELPSN